MSSISSIGGGIDPYQATNQNAFVQFVNNFNAIGRALQSGDLAGAQGALATFQQDLPGNGQSASRQPFGDNSQANGDFSNLGAALQSGDLTGAQKAFAGLQTDLESGGKTQRRGHHHDADAGGTQGSDGTNGATDSGNQDESVLDALA